MPDRSSRPEIRNPVLAMPAVREALATLDPAGLAAIHAVMIAIGAEAEGTCQALWRKRKGPMAAYWMAVGVYARHIARAIAKQLKSKGTLL